MTDKGGVNLLLFHCVFNEFESITHYLHKFDTKLYEALPNLYAVCISHNTNSVKKVIGGFFVKTSYSHSDEKAFLDLCRGIFHQIKEFQDFTSSDVRFLPAKIGVPDNRPLTENEMARLISRQAIKFSALGNA